MFAPPVLIPTLITALAVLVWNANTRSDLRGLVLKSRKRANLLPDKTGVRARLTQLGRAGGYESFRLRQCSVTAIAGVGFGFVTFLLGAGRPISTLAAAIAGAIAFAVVDRQLTREVVKYRQLVESEFASITEMLTLALSAGETPIGALTRISTRCSGALAAEFSSVIESVRAGTPFYEALDRLGRRIDSIPIRRFVDALVTAMVRGAPLIEVLQRHAAEARQGQRNAMMDKAGRAEMSMMVPVVFLILPISVLFALWPSLMHLNFFAA